MYITKSVLIWLVISSAIVIIDAFFILNRPETLPGGKYASFYAPYALYYQHDALYGPKVKDYFADIIAYLNLTEVFVTVIGLVLYATSGRKGQLAGSILAILASAFVLWKTVIYVWYDWQYMSQSARTFQNDGILLYWLPNSFWITCPLWSIVSISSRIGKQVQSALDGEKKKKA